MKSREIALNTTNEAEKQIKQLVEEDKVARFNYSEEIAEIFDEYISSDFLSKLNLFFHQYTELAGITHRNNLSEVGIFFSLDPSMPHVAIYSPLTNSISIKLTWFLQKKEVFSRVMMEMLVIHLIIHELVHSQGKVFAMSDDRFGATEFVNDLGIFTRVVKQKNENLHVGNYGFYGMNEAMTDLISFLIMKKVVKDSDEFFSYLNSYFTKDVSKNYSPYVYILIELIKRLSLEKQVSTDEVTIELVEFYFGKYGFYSDEFQNLVISTFGEDGYEDLTNLHLSGLNKLSGNKDSNFTKEDISSSDGIDFVDKHLGKTGEMVTEEAIDFIKNCNAS